MNFQIHALDPAPYTALFSLPETDLTARGIRRMTADSAPGYPCRVSLEDAAIGETVLLLNHEHLAGPSPFRASHAIYVRKNAARARPAPGHVPEVMARRVLSLRAFGAGQMLLEAEVIPGDAAAPALERLFNIPEVAQVHIHYAAPGCFAARALRA